MVITIDSGVIVERFFTDYHGHLKGKLPSAQGLLSQSLASLRESYAHPNTMTLLKRYFWVSEQGKQKQEEYFLAVENLLDSCVSILERLSEFHISIGENIAGSEGSNWLTDELKQIIYPYLASVFPLFNTEVQNEQALAIPEDLLGIHGNFYPDGFLQKAKGLQIELHTKSSDIAEHLKAIYCALYAVGVTFLGIWGQAISAGVIVVSGPLTTLPFVISVSLLCIGAIVNVADMRHTTKTNDKRTLDEEILIPLIESLEIMASFFNTIFSIQKNTDQIPQMRKDMQVGVEALHEIKQDVKDLKANQQRPTIIFNHTTVSNKVELTEGAMKQLLDAYSKGLISFKQLQILSGQTSSTPLQLTEALSGANESEYLSPAPRQRIISNASELSTSSEENSSPPDSRSSTPPTSADESGPDTPPLSQESGVLDSSPSSSKGKEKVIETVNVEVSAEELVLLEEFRNTKQQEIQARLDAA